MEQTAAAAPVKRERDYSFDNIKALLIFFVVLGHVLVSGKNHEINTIVYKCIYLFHMPLFVFISGYFSKKAAKSFSYSIHSALVPFVIFAIIFKIVECVVSPAKLGRMPGYLLEVPFSYWYLLCLFYWRAISPVFSKLKGFALPLAIILGIAGGFIPNGSALAVGRALAFLPFYWLGMEFTPDTVAAIRKCPKWVCALGLPAIFAGAVLLFKNVSLPYTSILQMKNSYAEAGMTPLTGIAVRLGLYIMAVLITVCAINLMPNRKCVLSHVGQATMSIYIAHGYIVLYLLRGTSFCKNFFASLSPLASLGTCLLISLAITALFSLPFFVKFFSLLTDWLANLCKKAFEPKKQSA